METNQTTKNLKERSNEIEKSLKEIKHDQPRRESLQKELSYIAFELVMRGETQPNQPSLHRDKEEADAQ